jgi:hypothetical protein
MYQKRFRKKPRYTSSFTRRYYGKVQKFSIRIAGVPAEI